MPKRKKSKATTPKSLSSIRDLIEMNTDSLTKSDLKIARVLLSKYPIAGLETMMELAGRADVSGPSVIRFVKRLGFEGFSDFQKTVHREVQSELGSPVALYSRRVTVDDDLLSTATHAAHQAVDETMQRVIAADFRRAARLLSEQSRPVSCIGGRFSGYAAGYFSAHLHQLRSGIRHLRGSKEEILEVFADITRKDVMVFFDVRRYQAEVCEFARIAKTRKASILLFTDVWGSPVSEFADFVFHAPVEAPSPFDSILGVMLVVETLIAEITKEIGDQGLKRLNTLEDLGVRGSSKSPE